MGKSMPSIFFANFWKFWRTKAYGIPCGGKAVSMSLFMQSTSLFTYNDPQAELCKWLKLDAFEDTLMPWAMVNRSYFLSPRFVKK
jgi:hypothetical protein